MKTRIKSKSFWIALVGAVIMLLQAFCLRVDVPLVNEIVSALCTIAILFGAMIDDSSTSSDKAKIEKIENSDGTGKDNGSGEDAV